MSLDEQFYLKADAFFAQHVGTGLTYEDVSLATRHSDILPAQTDLTSHLSERLTLSLPMLSSDMDTVTEAEMAIAMAINGGMGVLHANMSAAEQARQIARVKNHVHGLIQDPICIEPEIHIADVIALIDKKKFAFSTFPVVEKSGKLIGLLPGRVIKERYKTRKVSEAMTPRAELHTLQKSSIANDPIAAADRFFDERMGIHKVLVIDKSDKLHGLFTFSDIERISHDQQAAFKPARDENFRLLCSAAVSLPRSPDGQLNAKALIEHAGKLVDEGLDAIAISTAHALTESVGASVKALRENFPTLSLIAGNVTSAEGVEFLAKAGANAVKIGQGPGSICTTRLVAGVGVPQMTALHVAAKMAKKHKVKLIADGGITHSGDIVKALTHADVVMLGGLFAGCPEAPGELLKIDGKIYKQYRGMGSTAAMRKGSAVRYGHAQLHGKTAPEGVEALKEISSSADKILGQLASGVQSGLGYLGAHNLQELQQKARFVRVSLASQRESKTHDIIEVKASQK